MSRVACAYEVISRISELEGEIKKLKAENEGVQQSLRARIQQLEES